MNSLTIVAVTAALIGSALIGGVFFAFSSFVMKALARVPSTAGIAAMQSINVVVINPSFMGAFMGTALLSIGIIVLVLAVHDYPSTIFLLGGALLYFTGTFLVTMFGNVPLNERLAAVTAKDSAAVAMWEHYLNRWTLWNHVRTAAAVLASLLYSLGLMQTGGA